MKKRLFTLTWILMIGMIVGITSCRDDTLVKEDMRSAPTLDETRDLVTMSTLTNSVEWTVGQGIEEDKDDCEEKLGDGPYRTEDGWIHWNLTQSGGVTAAELILGGSGDGYKVVFPSDIDPPRAFKTGGVIQFFTPYFDLETLTATIYYEGTLGDNPQFVISDYCPGTVERLEVTKTVVTSFTREHFWDIDKKVETENGYELDDVAKIWLYTDGSGDETATWTVDVTYKYYDDSKFNVSGVITIENTGSLDAVITSIDDVLGGASIEIDCGCDDFELPYILPAGETLTCTYDEDGYFEGDNVVTVTTERGTYSATELIVWGDPTTEINKTVNIKDISDLFGEVDLGTVTAPNGDTFTYDEDFAWADYGADDCGNYPYNNEAKIVETGQSASATLKVNVQCFVYDTAYAKDGDDAICFIPTFSNWGWTNEVKAEGSYSYPLWAGAGGCDGGTHVGYFKFTANGGINDIVFDIFPGFDLRDTHVYAGKTMFPVDRRGRFINAPGQFYIEDGLDLPFWVIGHAVVGQPDPNFGP